MLRSKSIHVGKRGPREKGLHFCITSEIVNSSETIAWLLQTCTFQVASSKNQHLLMVGGALPGGQKSHNLIYRQTSNISHTLTGNKNVNRSNVVGA